MRRAGSPGRGEDWDLRQTAVSQREWREWNKNDNDGSYDLLHPNRRPGLCSAFCVKLMFASFSEAGSTISMFTDEKTKGQRGAQSGSALAAPPAASLTGFPKVLP